LDITLNTRLGAASAGSETNAATAASAFSEKPKLARTSLIDVHDAHRFKWLDIDLSAYPPQVVATLKLWHQVSSAEDKTKSEYLAACETSYVRFASASEGVKLADVRSMIVDLFVKNAPHDIDRLCMPPRTEVPSDEARSAFIDLILSVALKRRADSGLVAGASWRPLPFSQIVPLCSAVGAIAIMALPSL
jgi:hypothetical protein